MRVLLVTSQITYMPQNYLPLFKELFRLRKDFYIGLALLDNLDSKIAASTAGLFYLGANKIAKALVKNTLELPLSKREGLCHQNGIQTVRFKSMNDARAIQWVRDNKIDLIVNLRTRCIYKSEILSAPKLGCINIHHGILPKYRGTLCDLYALSEKRPAGFTIHQMNKKIDQGKILKTCEVNPGTENNYWSYLKETAKTEAAALTELLQEIETAGKITKGSENSCDDIVFTKNPDKLKIKSFINQGMTI
ncbi:MAG: hypothetical protein HN509_12810 [Halobacteriovoraceae bacterium]|nr:hypothetical protein [Halobacteriovoraceae bacterium]MBT5092803.1 hypothetical protein [Halobacteriovoraceae bacterium]